MKFKACFEIPSGKSVTKKISEIIDDVLKPYVMTIEGCNNNIPGLIPVIEKEIKERITMILNHAYIRIESKGNNENST